MSSRDPSIGHEFVSMQPRYKWLTKQIKALKSNSMDKNEH